jgi:hypothetical protein
VIDPGPGRHHPKATHLSDEAQCLSRRSHSNLDLRTHANPLDVRAEDIHEERIAFVAAVEPHFFSKQASRYAKARTAQVADRFQQRLTP